MPQIKRNVQIGPESFLRDRIITILWKVPQIGFIYYQGRFQRVYAALREGYAVWTLVQNEHDQQQYDQCATQTLTVEDALAFLKHQDFYNDVHSEYKRFYHSIGFPSRDAMNTFIQDLEEYHVELEEVEFDHHYAEAQCTTDRLLMPGEIAKIASVSNVCYLILNSTEPPKSGD